MTTNTTATMPAGWTQIAWTTVNNVTTTGNATVGTTTNDMTRFSRNIIKAWDATNKGQIDDIVGAGKGSVTFGGTTVVKYTPVHMVQTAVSGVPSGSQLVSWISYTSWGNMNVQSACSVGTIGCTVSYSTGGDIAALNATTAANTKGTTAIASTSTALGVTATS